MAKEDLFSKKVYQPAVRLANWNEDLFLEEEDLNKLLEQKLSNGLRLQRTNIFLASALQSVQLTPNHDGLLHDGDVVQLRWSGGTVPRYLAAQPSLPLPTDEDWGLFGNPCPLSGTADPRVCARTAFVVLRDDTRIPDSMPLMYGESFALRTIPEVGRLKLHSGMRGIFHFAKKSGHQEVNLVEESSARVYWRVLFRDPMMRVEMEGQYVPVNVDVVINHAFTNQHLALEPDYVIRSIFGVENEISVHNHSEPHRVLGPQNVWRFEAPPVDQCSYDTTINLPGQELIDPRNISAVIREDCFDDC